MRTLAAATLFAAALGGCASFGQSAGCTVPAAPAPAPAG
jgi:hypothetical protein